MDLAFDVLKIDVLEFIFFSHHGELINLSFPNHPPSRLTNHAKITPNGCIRLIIQINSNFRWHRYSIEIH